MYTHIIPRRPNVPLAHILCTDGHIDLESVEEMGMSVEIGRDGRDGERWGGKGEMRRYICEYIHVRMCVHTTLGCTHVHMHDPKVS